MRQIGRELGVRYVLEGSVRRIGDTLRVNVQLVSAETGAHLWSDRFDEEIRQLAVGQQQIIARYERHGLASAWSISRRRAACASGPTNPDAFDLILRARSMEHLPPDAATRQGDSGALRARACAGSVVGSGDGRGGVLPDR